MVSSGLDEAQYRADLANLVAIAKVCKRARHRQKDLQELASQAISMRERYPSLSEVQLRTLSDIEIWALCNPTADIAFTFFDESGEAILPMDGP